MAKGGRYLNKAKAASPRKRRKKGSKILLCVICVFVFLILGGIAGGVMYYNSMLNLISRPEATEISLSDEELIEILGYVPETVAAEDQPQETQPSRQEKEKEKEQKKEEKILNIMLIGQQYRKNEESKLSDTMILCSINKETKTITLTSFLRDLYVQLPNYKGHICGMNRINVAYNLGWRWAGELGGMEMLDTLIQENFGVEVDYNVEIGFETFIKVIDVIGGVEMELTADEASYMTTDQENDGSFTAGMNFLDGDAALSYARIRHANAGDSDFNRTNRQRKLITAILNKCKGMSVSQLNKMLQEILPLVITDMTNEEITACALELLPMLTDLNIVSNQCPAEGTYWFDMLQIAGVDSSVIKCDLEENTALLTAIAEG